MAQTVKHLSTMPETWVRSLGREDPLEKEMASHSSTLAWKIPWTEEPGGLQSTGSQRVGHAWATPLSIFSTLFKYSYNKLCFDNRNMNENSNLKLWATWCLFWLIISFIKNSLGIYLYDAIQNYNSHTHKCLFFFAYAYVLVSSKVIQFSKE